jgi:hypothetical protein
MPAKRLIVETPGGPALIQQPEGVSVVPFGSSLPVEIPLDDPNWGQLHKKLKTGKLDFATVKKEHGITEVQSN